MVSRDVRNVFVNVRKRIAKMLQVNSVSELFLNKENLSSKTQEHEGSLSFTTDAWTSPNHKAYVVSLVTCVHLEEKGEALSMLLDLIELARSHSGLNLATAFSEILKEFGISHKVARYLSKYAKDSPDVL